MISEAYIDRTVKEIFEEIEFPAAPAGLYDPLRYMISIGGKRIRPRLCILAYSVFKDDLYNEIVEPALALEVFHSFTLIHDDIMDRSPLRRAPRISAITDWHSISTRTSPRPSAAIPT